jgi:hypothetical protein
MSKSKWRGLWESGKTSSEREKRFTNTGTNHGHEIQTVSEGEFGQQIP